MLQYLIQGPLGLIDTILESFEIDIKVRMIDIAFTTISFEILLRHISNMIRLMYQYVIPGRIFWWH